MHEIRFRGRPIEHLSDTELRSAFKELLETVAALERTLVARGVIADGDVARRLHDTRGVSSSPRSDQTDSVVPVTSSATRATKE